MIDGFLVLFIYNKWGKGILNLNSKLNIIIKLQNS